MDVVGSAGGTILWDARKVRVIDSWWAPGGGVSLSTVIKEEEKGFQWMIVNVYGSVVHSRRKDLWDELNASRGRWSGAWCLGGDWNVIRFPSKRVGCSHLTADMEDFTNWIDPHSLVDLQLGGGLYTRSNQ